MPSQFGLRDPVFGLCNLRNIRSFALYKSALKVSSAEVTSLVQLEHLAWLDKQADELISDFSNGNLKGMYAKVAAISKRNKGTMKTTRVMDCEGYPTQDGIHEAKVFQEHFCKVR